MDTKATELEEQELTASEMDSKPVQQLYCLSIVCDVAAKFLFLHHFEKLMLLSSAADLKRAIVHLHSFHENIISQLEAKRTARRTYEHVQCAFQIAGEYTGVSQYVSAVNVALHDKLVYLPVSILKNWMKEVLQAITWVNDALPTESPFIADADAAFAETPLAITPEEQPVITDSLANDVDADHNLAVAEEVAEDQGTLQESDVDGEEVSSVTDEHVADEADVDQEASSVPSSSGQEVTEEAVAALTDDKVLELFLSYHTAFNNAVFDECQQLLAPEGLNDVSSVADGEDQPQYATEDDKHQVWEKWFRDVPTKCMDSARQAIDTRWVPLKDGEVEKDLKKSAALRGEQPSPRRKAVRRQPSVDDDDSDEEAGEYNAAGHREYRGREFRGRVAGMKTTVGDRATGNDDSSGSLTGTTESDSDDEGKADGESKPDADADKPKKKKSRKRKRRRKSSADTSSSHDDNAKADNPKKRKRRGSAASDANSPLAFDDDGENNSKPPSVKSTGSECQFLEQKTTPQKKSRVKTEADGDAVADDGDVEVISQTFHSQPTTFGQSRASTSTKKRYQPNAKKRKNIRRKYTGFDAATKRAMREAKKHSKLMNEKRLRIVDRFGDDSGVLDVIEPDSQLQTDGSSSQQKQLLVSVDEGLWKCLKRHQKAGVGFMYDAVVGSINGPEDYSRDDMEGCILAHQMGLGKTLQSFAIADTFYHDEDIPVRKILVLTPLNNRDNWENEIKIWSMKCTTCTGASQDPLKFRVVRGSSREQLAPLLNWTEGIIIMHYPLFTQVCKLTQATPAGEFGPNVNRKVKKSFAENPQQVQQLREKLLFGPDLVILDEAHVLKCETTQVYRSVMAIQTPAKIALTGTPLQNNLLEYFALIQLMRKGEMLNTRKRFENRFVKPIERGKTIDASPQQVSEMKKKSHVLYQMLRDVISFKDWSCIGADEKPKKHEHIISVKLSPIQEALYRKYAGTSDADADIAADDVDSNADSDELQIMGVLMPNVDVKERKSFLKYQRVLQRICVHPQVELEAAKRLVVPHTAAENGDPAQFTPAEQRQQQQVQQTARSRKQFSDEIQRKLSEAANRNEPLKNISAKVHIVREIIIESVSRNEKVLVFSQSLDVLDFLERMMKSGDMPKISAGYRDLLSGSPSQKAIDSSSTGKWEKGRHFDRIDGSDTPEARSKIMTIFNQNNSSVMVLLLSIKACALGVNLIGANRAILIDTDWNPSYDMQAVHRIYRFGQEKTCYVYRLISAGTIEEKMYRRQNFKQSLHKRVLQDQQSDRNFRETFTHSDLIGYEPPAGNMTVNLKPTAAQEYRSVDKLLQKIVSANRSIIVDVSDHDTLMLNKNEPELTDEEKALAYLEDECEDRGQEFKHVFELARPAIATLFSSAKYKKYASHGFTPAHFHSIDTLISALCEKINDSTMPGTREAFAKDLLADLAEAKLAHEIVLGQQYASSMQRAQQEQQRLVQKAQEEQNRRALEQWQLRKREQKLREEMFAAAPPPPVVASRSGVVGSDAMSQLNSSASANDLSDFSSESQRFQHDPVPQPVNSRPYPIIHPPPDLRPARAADYFGGFLQHSTSTPAIPLYGFNPAVLPMHSNSSSQAVWSPLTEMKTVGEAAACGMIYVVGSRRMQLSIEVGTASQMLQSKAGESMSDMYPPSGREVNKRPFLFVSRLAHHEPQPPVLTRGLILYTTPDWCILGDTVDKFVSQVGQVVERVLYTGAGIMEVHYADRAKPIERVDILIVPPPPSKNVIQKPTRLVPTSGSYSAASNNGQSAVNGRSHPSNATSSHFDGGSAAGNDHRDKVANEDPDIMDAIRRDFVSDRRSNSSRSGRVTANELQQVKTTSQKSYDVGATELAFRGSNNGFEQQLPSFYMPATSSSNGRSSSFAPAPPWEDVDKALSEVTARERQLSTFASFPSTYPTEIRSSKPFPGAVVTSKPVAGRSSVSSSSTMSTVNNSYRPGAAHHTSSSLAGSNRSRTSGTVVAGQSSRHSVASATSSSSMRSNKFFSATTIHNNVDAAMKSVGVTRAANSRDVMVPNVDDRVNNSHRSLLNPGDSMQSTNKQRPTVNNLKMPSHYAVQRSNPVVRQNSAAANAINRLSAATHQQQSHRRPRPRPFPPTDDEVICVDDPREKPKSSRIVSTNSDTNQPAKMPKPISRKHQDSVVVGPPQAPRVDRYSTPATSIALRSTDSAQREPSKSFFGSSLSVASNTRETVSGQPKMRPSKPKPAIANEPQSSRPPTATEPSYRAVTFQNALSPTTIQQHYIKKPISIKGGNERAADRPRQRHGITTHHKTAQLSATDRERPESSSSEGRAPGRRQTKPVDRWVVPS